MAQSPHTMRTLGHNKTKKAVVQFHGECQGMIQAKVGMLWSQVGFKLLSGGGQGGSDTNLIWKSILNSGSITSKTITCLTDL